MEGYQQEGLKEEGGKGTENKKYKWQVQNRQGDVKNGIGNRKAKELTCTTHGHELREAGILVRERGCREEGKKGKKNSITVIAQSIKYT